MTPSQKQALSGLAVAILGAAGTAIEQALSNPPFTLRSLLMAAGVGALLGLVHYLPTLGTKAVVQAKAIDLASSAMSREALIAAAANSNSNHVQANREG